jgi:hypothetical protein
MQVARYHRERRVIGQALKKLSNVGDPERPLKSGLDFAQTLGKRQAQLLE